jgi:hypothetical protein
MKLERKLCKHMTITQIGSYQLIRKYVLVYTDRHCHVDYDY